MNPVFAAKNSYNKDTVKGTAAPTCAPRLGTAFMRWCSIQSMAISTSASPHNRTKRRPPAGEVPAGGSACRKSDTLQGEPISARSRATEIPSPWYPPGDKIKRRTAHSAQRASHTLCAQFPCMCPDRTHMSSGRDFFDSQNRPRGSPCGRF